MIWGEGMPKVVFKKEYYNIKEISEMLGITDVTIRTYFSTGRMRGVKLGNAWYSTQEDIEQFLKMKTEPKNKGRSEGGPRYPSQYFNPL